MPFAESNMIKRGRIGVHDAASDAASALASFNLAITGGMTPAALEAFWSNSAGITTTAASTVNANYQAGMAAMASGQWTPSQTSQVNLAHWAAYTGVASPQQLATYQASKGGSSGGISSLLSKIPFVGSMLGGLTTSAPAVVAQPVATSNTGFYLLLAALAAGGLYLATAKPAPKPKTARG